MATPHEIDFECVRNGDSYEFRNLLSRMYLLDGFPELLHVSVDNNGNDTLASFRGGIEHAEMKFNRSFFCNRHCDGKNIYMIEADDRSEGIVITCKNGWFQTEKVQFPPWTPLESFHRVHDSTYFVTRTDTEFVVSTRSQASVVTFPSWVDHANTSFCFVGHRVVVFSYIDQTTAIKIHDLTSNSFSCARAFEGRLKIFTSFEDRWLIIVGRPRVYAIDCYNMEVETFNYAEKAGDVLYCAARRYENVVELFFSAGYIYGETCRIYKAFIPIKGVANNNDQPISPNDEEMTALKVANSEASDKIAQLESIVAVHEEKIAALERKCTSMLLMMLKK